VAEILAVARNQRKASVNDQEEGAQMSKNDGKESAGLALGRRRSLRKTGTREKDKRDRGGPETKTERGKKKGGEKRAAQGNLRPERGIKLRAAGWTASSQGHGHTEQA